LYGFIVVFHDIGFYCTKIIQICQTPIFSKKQSNPKSQYKPQKLAYNLKKWKAIKH